MVDRVSIVLYLPQMIFFFLQNLSNLGIFVLTEEENIVERVRTKC
jgi:hypothetical protein